MPRASSHEGQPLAYTVSSFARISDLGETSIWKAIKEGRIKAVRPLGVRRTLIDAASAREFLAAQPPRRGRPRKQRVGTGSAV